MTNQEIVEYLKGNREKGVIFKCMPEEVKEWCNDNLMDTSIPFRKLTTYSYKWVKLNYDENFEFHSVYCLTEDYDPENKFKGHWVEYDINEENGSFMVRYHWWEWSEFLSNHAGIFNNFGGWLYADGKWRTYPALYRNIRDVECYNGTCGDNCEPVTPAKIRFWKYRE